CSGIEDEQPALDGAACRGRDRTAGAAAPVPDSLPVRSVATALPLVARDPADPTRSRARDAAAAAALRRCVSRGRPRRDRLRRGRACKAPADALPRLLRRTDPRG